MNDMQLNSLTEILSFSKRQEILNLYATQQQPICKQALIGARLLFKMCKSSTCLSLTLKYGSVSTGP